VKPVVVADTSPIVYLRLIQQIDILPSLFDVISIPIQVYEELSHPSAPSLVRDWAKKRPHWLSVLTAPETNDVATTRLDAGEREAIALAEHLNADLILMDERKGTRVCPQKGFSVVGTLGLLDLAARRGIVDFVACVDELKTTKFRYRPEMLARMKARIRNAE
jgi:predicted nucleic acid-binding protein